MTMILLPLYHQLMSMEYNKCRFFFISNSIGIDNFFPSATILAGCWELNYQSGKQENKSKNKSYPECK